MTARAQHRLPLFHALALADQRIDAQILVRARKKRALICNERLNISPPPRGFAQRKMLPRSSQ